MPKRNHRKTGALKHVAGEYRDESGRLVFDVAQYDTYLQSLVPELKFSSEEFPQYEAISLIRDFVSRFSFTKEGRADLSMVPENKVLEALAERFRRYLRSSTSLDEAFGLKSNRRGRRSAKITLSLRDQSIRARALYRDLRVAGKLKKQAVPEVAEMLNITQSKAHTLLFRRTS